ncbi:multicopper oxidase family protein [Lentisalinibacter sediminis]|uniref:multicopper oxidase family protein n=1 Tax=Lentisalinibacter sediminis TaxID=2992237 RepID=UPI00386F5159
MFIKKAYGAEAAANLSNPALQPKFVTPVPDALSPTFKFRPRGGRGGMKQINVGVGASVQQTGLMNQLTNTPASTPVFGYGDKRFVSWPGRTFEVESNKPLKVIWENNLGTQPLPIATFAGEFNPGNPWALSPVDTSLHWAYSLHGYTEYSLKDHGIPIVPHVHGGHTDPRYDGNPEYFWGPNQVIQGPRYTGNEYVYDNDQPAGTVWYHDHALGITRLNVYAGMAGFYIIRDAWDTGKANNSLSLPAWPYEAALAIQDKMFTADGKLFYPSFPGDPFYADFIFDEGADLSGSDYFTNVAREGDMPAFGPTALAEFFGDHFLVNGAAWPKMDVEPRNYRLRLLNGCDSRFLVVTFRPVMGTNALNEPILGEPLSFHVIGSDQGIATEPKEVSKLLIETGSRYDVIFDFKKIPIGCSRIIVENLGGDDPFGGGILEPGGPGAFPEMRQIMAFDVVLPFDIDTADITPVSGGPAIFSSYVDTRKAFPAYQLEADSTKIRTRKVALFEGTDEYGRLQPLLGTAEPATDSEENPIFWPETQPYSTAGLAYDENGNRRQMEGAIAWHSPTTENPALGATEIWEIYNTTGDAHPIHLHLVHFEVLNRQECVITTEPQPVIQHNSTTHAATWGTGAKITNIELGADVNPMDLPEYVENAPKDMVTALPGQVTRIKMKFDRGGRYVWHCHILSHEDHEMMRVLHVGPGA